MRRRLLAFLIALPCVISPSLADGPVSPVRSDERVILFPTLGILSEDGKSWLIPIHGWIFEPEEHDFLRARAMDELKDALNLDPRQPTTSIFEKRARRFLVDNERGKRIVIQIGEVSHRLKPSNIDGHFTGSVTVPAAMATRLAKKGTLPIHVKLFRGDRRNFRGKVHLLPPEGLSVISDIDDTIKISEVTDRKRLVENTFFKPFQAVEGMAEVYAKWKDAGATFHYVSSSPWQLYEPLSEFLRETGFPEGTYHLKRMRLKDSSFWTLFADPEKTKPPVIEPILKAYPQRKFVLVGDSGEKDPEVYGAIAAKFPNQVQRVLIRDVTGEPENSARYQRAFRDVPRSKWALFRDPKGLTSLGDPLGKSVNLSR